MIVCLCLLAWPAPAGTAVAAPEGPGTPAPAETPVEIVLSGRTSTLKSISIIKTGQQVPPNFSDGKVSNTPGFEWYVSRHFACKTDMGENWARQCLTWSELAWPHAAAVMGGRPDGLDGRRMAMVYGKSLSAMRDATFTDGGFRWHSSGGGVTFDFLKAAYNYPSGSLKYHKRELVIHENLHLLQACLTGSCRNTPNRFLEGATYAFANHVYNERKGQLTLAVLDKATVNNPLDAALRELAERPRSIRELLESDAGPQGAPGAGPVCGLYTQFMWTDPDRLMKWRLWRDGLFAAATTSPREIRQADSRLMTEIYGDLDALDRQWKAWLARRTSTFHYVDWGWEQDGDTLWSYGWPQKTPFSQTNINLPLGEKPAPDPLRMDWPAEEMPAHLVGPVSRGSAEPAVAALLDFSRNPGKGLCGLAFGVILETRRPGLLPRDAKGQLNVYVREGRTLILDGDGLGAGKVEAPIARGVLDAMQADGHRVGLTVRVAAGELLATLRAGKPAGQARGKPARQARGKPDAVASFSARLPLTDWQRNRILQEPSAVIAKDGYHGVTPYFDDLRPAPPDLTRPAPANRWRFAGEQETWQLYRAARTLGQAAPNSLLDLRTLLAGAMDKPPADQADAMTHYRARINKVVADLRALPDNAHAQAALAELQPAKQDGR
jgi:hypothetical protein